MVHKVKSFGLQSGILLRAYIFINFILLKAHSVVVAVADTEIVRGSIRRFTIMKNACCNDETSKYKSTLFFDCDCFTTKEHYKCSHGIHDEDECKCR